MAGRRDRLDADLVGLATLSPARLQAQWVSVASKPLPRVSAAMLRLALGHELQVQALGGLSRSTQQRLAQCVAAKTQTQALAPGSRLVREWQGSVHVVTVGEDGAIRWNERQWRSLSEVARAITGTRWSGPAFFGLKQRSAAA